MVKQDQTKYIAQCSSGWWIQNWSRIWNPGKLWRRPNEVQTCNWRATQRMSREQIGTMLTRPQSLCRFLENNIWSLYVFVKIPNFVVFFSKKHTASQGSGTQIGGEASICYQMRVSFRLKNTFMFNAARHFL